MPVLPRSATDLVDSGPNRKLMFGMKKSQQRSGNSTAFASPTPCCTSAPEAKVFSFLALGSNHNPLLLTTELNPLRRRKTFTFEAFWLQDKDCRTVIRDAWASSPLPVSSLSCKLQDTSLALTRWSKSKFSNGQKQIHLLWSCIASLVDLEGAQPLHLLTSTHQPQSACGSGSYQCNAYQ